MKNIRIGALAIVCTVVGGVAASYLGAEIWAQEPVNESQAWEIYHGVHTPPRNADDGRFYVIRHNRLTGDTEYIRCDDRGGCTQLRVEVQN